MRVYILQKDLPDVKAGAEFSYSDRDDTYDYTASGGEACWYKKSYVENSDWFKLKEEEKPVVLNSTFYDKEVEFKINHPDKCYWCISKERLAEILIAESKGELHIMKRAFPAQK